MDRKKSYMVGGVAALLVVGIFMAIVLMNRNSCKAGTDIPVKEDFGKLSLMQSSDNKAIGKVDAYLSFSQADGNKTTTTYLPLAMKSVNQIDAKKADYFTMELVTDCCTVDIDIDRSDKTNQKFVSVSVNEIANKDGKNTCLGPMYQWPKANHYLCQETQVYTCYGEKDAKKEKVVANLYIQSMEFEVNGNPEQIKTGKFSTDALDCSKMSK